MKKRTVIIASLALLAAGLSAAALSGCAKEYKFEEYSFNYGGTSEKDWRALEFPDQDIAMDGVVKTEEYGNGYISFSDVNDVNMKVYAHLGEEGVFFGFVSNDRYVNYNPRNDVFNNTSVEIQVAANGTETLNANVVQLRLGANGTPDQWVGFPSEDGYSYSKKYIPGMGVVHIDGELNGSAEGYSVELYLPYTSIGLSERPASVVCAPSFNTMPDPLSSQRATWTMMLGCDLSQPATWYVVDETGMTAHTAGFKLKNNGIAQDKGFNEFYYFDTAPHSAYYLKTKLNVLSTGFLNGDNYPKFGLVNKSEHALQTFHVDAAQRTGTNFGSVHAEQTTAGGTDWMWDTNASTSMEGHWGNSYIGNYRGKQLETIYYGGDLYFVLNDVLVKSVKNFAPEEEGAVPGFMCFNTKATFVDYEFETDAAKVKSEAEKFMAKDRKIDGDLSDWTDEDIDRHAKSAEDPNGNSMKVRAFRGTDGLYLAYEVHHIVNIPAKKWDDGWWLNTNIEFFVNGAAETNHYALTSFGDSGYMDGVMVTERLADRTYSSVGEIFLPFTALQKDGFDLSATANVGFAFKSANGTADDKLNGTDWWSFEGEPNAVLFPVQGKGIGTEYTLTYSAGSDAGVTGNVPAAVNVFEGDTLKLPENPFTRAGFKFVGWTDGERLFGAGAEFTMPSSDVTLSPKWVSESAKGPYHVTYEKGEGLDVAGQEPTDDAEYYPGDAVTVLEGDLKRDGYRFLGWSYGADVYRAGSKLYIEDKDVTLTAVWAKLYSLSYTLGGAEGEVPAGGEYIEGEQVVLPGGDFTKSGYDFYGWKYKDTVYHSGVTFEMPAENVVFTAEWKPQLKVDGSLTDWEALESKTVGAHSLTDGRGATWYGVLREEGVYLAVEYYHNNEPKTDQRDWWLNTNFEIHMNSKTGGNRQFYVYLKDAMSLFGTPALGADAQYDLGTSQAKFMTGSGGGTATFRSVFEVFYPNSVVEQFKENGAIRIGLAIKTDGGSESITGGSVNFSTGDPWYAPYGVWPDDPAHYAYLTGDGLLLKEEYEHPDWTFGAQSAAEDGGITVDGNLADWSGSHTIGITGTDLYDGKGVTFYGKMTKAGLYLAAEAYHETFTTGQGNWFNNTNFELRIGNNWGGEGNRMPKQFWVNAVSMTSCSPSEAYMTAAWKTEEVSGHGNAGYHSVVEVFLPAANFIEYDYMVQNGMIQVGVAWKTDGDKINNGALSDDPWWMPKGTHCNSNPARVDGSGIYTAGEYAAK